MRASFAIVFMLWAASPWILIPYVAHLLLLVTAILYAACHGSLILLWNNTASHDENTDTKNAVPPVDRETLRAQDAYQFPLVGSVSLFSLYCAFKFLDAKLVNLLIGVYFGGIGVAAIALTLAPVVAPFLPRAWQQEPVCWTHQLRHPTFFFSDTEEPTETEVGQKENSDKPAVAGEADGVQTATPTTTTTTTITTESSNTHAESGWEWEVMFTVADLLAGGVGAAIVALYYATGKPWYLNNVMGIAFCLQGMERFSLGTYKIGAILLIGLFFYDIFWVFGTDVMVTVAKSLDGPIKILLPRSFAVDDATGKLKDLSLLGLGDIVIPGFFLALLLRFDAHKAAVTRQQKEQQQSSSSSNTSIVPVRPMQIHEAFPKPYFHTALLAYVAGLGLTLFIMFRFHAAQPALLYLVPACLGSSFITALVRGEVKELFAYSEEEEEEEEEEVGESSKGNDGRTETKKDK